MKLVVVKITTAFGGVTVYDVDYLDVDEPFTYIRENYETFATYGNLGDLAVAVIVSND